MAITLIPDRLSRIAIMTMTPDDDAPDRDRVLR
jgi:hypothetical protein